MMMHLMMIIAYKIIKEVGQEKGCMDKEEEGMEPGAVAVVKGKEISEISNTSAIKKADKKDWNMYPKNRYQNLVKMIFGTISSERISKCPMTIGKMS